MAVKQITIPYLILGQTYVFEYEYDSPPAGTPTWVLFTEGIQSGSPANGANVGGNLWRFDITVPSGGINIGVSARVRIADASLDLDLYTAIADTSDLVEKNVIYRHRQIGVNLDNKYADAIVEDVP